MMGRASIWTKTLVVVAVYAVTISVVDLLLFRGLQRGLALALAFALVQTVAIVVMLAVLLTRRGVAEMRASRSEQVSEAAAAAVAEHAAGNDRLRVLRELRRESPRDVDRALASFLASTKGSMQERVGALARDLDAGTRPRIERAATASLFDRVLLAHETRAQALELARVELPRALASGDETSMIAALDLLRGWRVSLSVANFENAFAHPSAEVRRRAFLALPYMNLAAAPHIIRGLHDASAPVRAAAAQAAGRLRIAAAALEGALGDSDYDVALAAAFALAATPEGLAALQRHVGEGNRIAFEAVEKAAMGRLELA